MKRVISMKYRVGSHIETESGKLYIDDCVMVALDDGTQLRGLIKGFTGKGFYIYNGMEKDPFVHCVTIVKIDIDHEAWVI